MARVFNEKVAKSVKHPEEMSEFDRTIPALSTSAPYTHTCKFTSQGKQCTLPSLYFNPEELRQSK
jgi:hypothetical protein